MTDTRFRDVEAMARQRTFALWAAGIFAGLLCAVTLVPLLNVGDAETPELWWAIGLTAAGCLIHVGVAGLVYLSLREVAQWYLRTILIVVFVVVDVSVIATV